jgi:hypothetical protein
MQISRLTLVVQASCLMLIAHVNALRADDASLAQELTNPVASLISVPIQYNYDRGFGLGDDGDRHLINVQPVIPITLNEDWTVVSRTIVPIVAQDEIFTGAGDQFGLGDVVQSFFFSPKQPTGSIVWGAGPVILAPTGTDRLLSAEKWGAGPTAVLLSMQGPWTIGVLANHIWSFAGEDRRADVSASFIQPFITYTTPDAWTFALNTESTYDWEGEAWSVPINASVSKLLKFGSQPVSLGATVRYWAEAPEAGPEGWALRSSLTFLFPTGG